MGTEKYMASYLNIKRKILTANYSNAGGVIRSIKTFTSKYSWLWGHFGGLNSLSYTFRF